MCDAAVDVEVRSVSRAKKHSEANVGEAAQAVTGLVDNLVSKMCEEFPQLRRSRRRRVAASVTSATDVTQVKRATRSAAKVRVATPSVKPVVTPSVTPAMRSAVKGRVTMPSASVKGAPQSVKAAHVKGAKTVKPATRSVTPVYNCN